MVESKNDKVERKKFPLKSTYMAIVKLPSRILSGSIIYKNIFSFFLFLLIYVLILRIFFSFLFLNIPYNIFEIGGTLPGQPFIYLQNSFISNWMMYSNYGFQGEGLIYSVWFFLLMSLFRSIAVAERAWFIFEFTVGALSSFFLFKKLSRSTILAFIFSLSFSFSPVVANMVISGAYMIYILYAFTPLLILLTLKIFESEFLLRLEYSIIFAILSAFIFEFNPGEIMWTPVFLIFYFLLIVAFSIRKRSNFISLVVSTVLLFLVFLMLTRTLSLVLAVFGGNTVAYFSSNDFGATSITQILMDLQFNFNGWLSFVYWYPALFFELLVLVVATVQHRLKMISKTVLILIFAIGIQTLIILLTWATFHFNIMSLTIIIATYLPFLGEYIPHMGYVLIVAYLIIQTGAIVGFQHQTESASIVRKPKNLRKLITTKNKVRIISIVIFVFLFATTINFQTNYPGDSSSLGMYTNSDSFMLNNAVPNNVAEISSWFVNNTALNQGYRILFFPYSMSTDNVILSDMRWTFMTNITNQASFTLYGFTHNYTEGLATFMADSGVEFIIVYFGPFLGIDNKVDYTGPPRFYGSGFSWEMTWVPAGSPAAWSEIFNSSPYFKIAGKAGNAIIYRNDLYEGSIISYSLGNITKDYFQKNAINPVYYDYSTMNLLLNTNEEKNIDNWHTYNSENNVSILRENGSEALYFPPVTNNVTYRVAYSFINLLPNSSYILSYDISGKNISGSWILIYFYDKNGNQISVFGSKDEPHTIWYGEGDVSAEDTALFTTPSNYSLAKMVALAQYGPSDHYNNSYTLFSDIKIENVTSIKPESVRYAFSQPWLVYIFQRFSGNFAIRFLTSYNPSWTLIGGNEKYASADFYSGYRNENLFWVNSNSTLINPLIYFTHQGTYTESLYEWGLEWCLMIITIPILDIYRKKESKRSLNLHR